MNIKFKNKYFRESMAIFAAGVGLILFYRFITNFNGVTDAISVVSRILSPFIIGLVIAYLLCPFYNILVKHIYPLLKKHVKNTKKAFIASKIFATTITLVVSIGVLSGFLWLIIPELVDSIIGILQVFPSRMNTFIDWIQGHIDKYPNLLGNLEEVINQTTRKIITWAQHEFIPGASQFMNGVSQGIIGTFTTVSNILVGIIISVYFLNSKETFKAQTKKLVLATTNEEKSKEIFEFGVFANKTFGGFINGKIIDSIIIGIICFIAMNILKLPLPTLISVIIGVTNIIPFFGPFIGAIPSTLIIFLIDPIKALYFLIMVFVLQQLDGNVIGPSILGESTGLASFWVMFAIIVGGGMFGFVGMILGVPVFAIIYHYISKMIKHMLSKKSYPVETREYEDYNNYGIDKEEIWK